MILCIATAVAPAVGFGDEPRHDADDAEVGHRGIREDLTRCEPVSVEALADAVKHERNEAEADDNRRARTAGMRSEAAIEARWVRLMSRPPRPQLPDTGLEHLADRRRPPGRVGLPAPVPPHAPMLRRR